MEKSLSKQPRQLEFLGQSFELLPNALIVHGRPTIKEFDDAFKRLTFVESAVAWWYGDLANARERDYGSLKEMAERLEINYQSLRHYQSICERYKLCTRMHNLSFKHHQIAAPLEDRLDWLNKAANNGWSAAELAKQIRIAQILPPNWNGARPIIDKDKYLHWLPKQPYCDLFITDPPYSTDIKNIEKFAAHWLPMALGKVKTTGRAYVFIGPYPKELQAYLRVNTNLNLANVMVWEYQNTIGPSSKLDYNLNWQAILYYRGSQAPELDCPILTEQFAVQSINAPDGRTGVRFNEWQKPDELAERLIRHSTKPGQLVLDCFAGTGTFILTAAKFNRQAKGCDISQRMVDIAIQRGCQVGD